MAELLLSAFTGVVETRSDSSHTETTYEQGSNRVVSSHTTHRSDVVLVGADGTKHVVNTAAAKVYLAEGSSATLVMASRKEKGYWPFVAVHDHASGKTGYFAKGVNDLAGPPLYNTGIILAVFVGGFSIINLSGKNIVLVGLAAWFFYELYRRRKIVRAKIDALIAQSHG
ncbi:MAG: hypothetical protein U1F14_14020 [Steroidobacteraceae bacterium]